MTASVRTVADAKPYAYDFDIRRTALLVIDMQNDFCEPGGFGELLGNDIRATRGIIPVVAAVLAAARLNKMPIIHTREGHASDLSDCPASKLRRSRRQGAGIGDEGPMGRILVQGEKGHAIVSELTPLPGEFILDKPGKGAFYRTNLEELLRQHAIESLIVTGVTTHVCVHTTVREANDRGYECLVLEDATAAFEQEDHDAAIRMIRQQGGIFGWTAAAESFMNAMK